MSADRRQFRRRRSMVLRVADEMVLGIAQFLKGQIAVDHVGKFSVLCPITCKTLVVTADELSAVAAVPAHRWLDHSEFEALDAEARMRLVDLARRGILLADPPFDGWETLSEGEQALEQAHWLDLAAVFHAHSGWDGVVGLDVMPGGDKDSAHAQVERMLGPRADPPPHFHERADARKRIEWEAPALSDPFFDILLSRRTTRAYRTDERLASAALEKMLYAVFGTQGTKQLAPGFTVLKRTSPSGGALHSIEAYVLTINVADVPPGLYHYETGSHSLAELELLDIDSARELALQFTAGQAYFAEAHALVVHVARFERSFWKYSRHRKAYKSVLMDSGHLSQTFYLTATHLGLGAFYTAAINDVDISRRLRLAPQKEAAVAINGVGLAATGRDELHFMPDRYTPGSNH